MNPHICLFENLTRLFTKSSPITAKNIYHKTTCIHRKLDIIVLSKHSMQVNILSVYSMRKCSLIVNHPEAENFFLSSSTE